ncbi:MAG: hypothetical protein ACI81L_002679 [Verrucomicrobiales bacterium]|jgi:hypothetical protein
MARHGGLRGSNRRGTQAFLVSIVAVLSLLAAACVSERPTLVSVDPASESDTADAAVADHSAPIAVDEPFSVQVQREHVLGGTWTLSDTPGVSEEALFIFHGSRSEPQLVIEDVCGFGQHRLVDLGDRFEIVEVEWNGCEGEPLREAFRRSNTFSAVASGEKFNSLAISAGSLNLTLRLLQRLGFSPNEDGSPVWKLEVEDVFLAESSSSR